MGAAAGTIEVQVEVDVQRNLVRAVATGATELRTRDLGAGEHPPEARRAMAARSMGCDESAVQVRASTDGFEVMVVEREDARLLGFWKERRQWLRVAHAACSCSRATAACAAATGKEIPDVFLVVGRRIVDLSGLSVADQVVSLGQAEMEGLPSETEVVIVSSLR